MKTFIDLILGSRQRTVVLVLCLITVIAGIWALKLISSDAIPDVSENQVIIYVKWNGQDPQVIQDQVTYPIVTTMLHVPHMRSVRGYSSSGFALVYVLLQDGVDQYWARSRVLEYLDQTRSALPADPNLSVGIGPDATGVGWIYEYALTSTQRTLTELRSLQDWYLRFGLQSVPGISEVASLGGAVKEYQIFINPDRLRAYDIPLKLVLKRIQDSNMQQSGRWIENAGGEFLVRGLGYINSHDDLEKIVLKTDSNGVPVTVRDIARVIVGMQERRGAVDLNGEGQVVGGIVVARAGEDVAALLRNVKSKLLELKASLPDDIKITPVYDRSRFIEQSIDSVQTALGEELIIVSLVVFLFLVHGRSSLVILLPLPIALLGSVFLLKVSGVSLNIMTLSGIAIAIGTMVDAVIVVVENAHKHIERLPATSTDDNEERKRAIVNSLTEVMTPILVSMGIIALAFLPVLLLSGEEGRLFRPLVLAKTFAVLSEILLVVFLVPILMLMLIKGRIRKEEDNKINRIFTLTYRGAFWVCMRHQKSLVMAVCAAFVAALFIYRLLGSEFMPSVYEGDILYMPTTMPAISITEAEHVVQQQDMLLKKIPEVESVFGKVGRADTATDPAPLSMFETIIQLKPRRLWRPGITETELLSQMDEVTRIPGLVNGWTMPIRGRIDMLSTGIKTPLGLKVFGPSYQIVDKVSGEIRNLLGKLSGTRNVFADQSALGRYLDLTIDRDKLERYDLVVGDVQRVIQYGIGGGQVGTTVEGLERYPITVRYQGDTRASKEQIMENTLVYSPNAGYIPLGYVTSSHISEHPAEIKTENGMPVDYIYVDIVGADIGSYVSAAERKIQDEIKLPIGVYYQWSGQYEGIGRVHSALVYVIPVVLITIGALYYLLYGTLANVFIILLSVPFSLIGAVWFMWMLGYHISVASIVGMIALTGISAQTTVVMLVYLELARVKAEREGRLTNVEELYRAIYDGAVLRLRPKMMTVLIVIFSLLPILATHGVGADVAKRIAAPMIGGMVTSAVLVLLIVPAVYGWVLKRKLGLTGKRGTKP